MCSCFPSWCCSPGAARASHCPHSFLHSPPTHIFKPFQVKGYLKALPGATHFLATADSQAVALWQLMPHETPRNELLAGWTRILKVPPRLWRQLLRLELHYEKAHAQVRGWQRAAGRG